MLLPLLKAPLRLAHEVYVLNGQQIAADKHAPKTDPWSALHSSHDRWTFLIYGLAITLSLLLALYLKSRNFFQKIGQLIDRATVIAPDIIRISLGASLIAAGHFHSVFGPELPSNSFAGSALIGPGCYIVGIGLVLGLGSRLLGALVSAFWVFTLFDKGWYMLTYANYFGEALALAIIPRQKFSLDALLFKAKKTKSSMEPWAMPVARILFGFSLLYAAVNVKFVTTALSLQVVNQYDLTRYFHFDPLFVVLGAGLVEILIASLYMLGLLQRLNSLMFIGFITASLLFFKEAVWPHYLLLGLAVGIFLHKPDKLALDSRLFKRK